jgi:hypothetical protein
MLDVSLVEVYIDRFNTHGSQVTRIKPDRAALGVADQWRILQARNSGLSVAWRPLRNVCESEPCHVHVMREVWVPDEDPASLLFVDDRGHEYIVGPLPDESEWTDVRKARRSLCRPLVRGRQLHAAATER